MPKSRPTRRDAIGAGLAAGAAAALPTIFPGASWARSQNVRNAPSGGAATIGVTAALTGAYAEEGADQLRACELAVEHINGAGDGGMLATFSSGALDGGGILGRRAALVTGDTETDAGRARAAARRMIERDGAIMVTGGSSSGVAVAVQALCHEAGIVFMAGLSHANDTTGKDRRATGFRHFLNSYMSGAALAPVLRARYGEARRAYHLTADYEWGKAAEAAIRSRTEAIGWETVAAVRTRPTRTNFTGALAPVPASGADVLILNHYGGDMVNSLKAVARQRLAAGDGGRDFEVVVPLMTELLVREAGPAAAGVIGTQNWHPRLQVERGDRYAGTDAFVRSFTGRYRQVPSQAAHTCYVQTILYADAVARAGTFDPCAVVEALEDFAFDGLGSGPTIYRAADHQCFKDVVVVRGTAGSDDAPTEIVAVTPAADVAYPPDHPLFAGGDLGACSGAV